MKIGNGSLHLSFPIAYCTLHIAQKYNEAHHKFCYANKHASLGSFRSLFLFLFFFSAPNDADECPIAMSMMSAEKATETGEACGTVVPG